MSKDASEGARAKEIAPHYAGHRQRLRERARGHGFSVLADYELLEFFLFRSIRMGDVKPTAKALLARFGSLGAVVGASAVELRSVPGVGEETALDLRALQDLALRLVREPTQGRTVISSWSALLAYVRLALQHEAREQVRVLYLDQWQAFSRTFCAACPTNDCM